MALPNTNTNKYVKMDESTTKRITLEEAIRLDKILEDKVEQQVQQIDKLVHDLKQLQGETHNNNIGVSLLKDRLSNRDNTTTNMQNDINILKSNINHNARGITEAEDQLKNRIDSNYTSFNAHVTDLYIKINQLTKDIDDIPSIQEIEDSCIDSKSLSKQNRSTLNHLINSFNAVNDRLTALEEEPVNKQPDTGLYLKDVEIKQLKNAVKALNEVIVDKDKEIKDKEESIKMLSDLVNTKTDCIYRLESTIDNLRDTNKIKDSTIEVVGKEMEALQDKLQEDEEQRIKQNDRLYHNGYNEGYKNGCRTA